jgi:CarboxypepD_reg-like domain/TonB-dependent Receptor Plug Domain
MRIIKPVLILSFLLFLLPVFGQENHIISGYIKDASSGEDLIAANVYLKSDNQTGATANTYGFYSLSLPQGNYTLIVAYIGYQTQEFTVHLTRDTTINIDLTESSTVLEEVVIEGERKDQNITGSEMSKNKLTIEEIEKIPAFMGEVDVLKAIQLLPGVQSAGEGNGGFYVRGGGPDQNLVLLDKAIVYNPGHLFGFFSVFNSDVIKNTTLIKGGMPAQYGGRLSSVLDISMKEGNNQKFQAEGGIGIISSRLTVQGPIVKNKASFVVSGRRTYIDILMKPFVKGSNFEGNAYHFYDLNAKANYTLSEKDRLFLSGYFGRDVFQFTGAGGDFKVNVPWGNSTFTARWNHLFSNKLFMNTSFILNKYNFSTEGTQLDWNFKLDSDIRDYNAKVDFEYFTGNNSNLKFGVDYIYHRLAPVTTSFTNTQDSLASLIPSNIKPKFAHEAAVYAAYEFSAGYKWKFNAGLRFSAFQQVGPYTYFVEDTVGDVIDTVFFKKGEGVKFYSGLEPRFSTRYLINESTSLKASFAVNKQYVHMVSNSSTSLPNDVWVPSSKLVKPQNSMQIAVGLFKNFKENAYETSVELYYKKMNNLIEFEDGYTPALNIETERSFVFGKGYSYGAEFFVKKRYGKLNGWIGYTWSKTYRTFADINQGNPFPAKYDRRHDLSIVASYDFNDRMTLSATFVYGTGNTFTMPESWYVIDGVIVQEYVGRNNYRMKPYHRLDLAFSIKGAESKKFSSKWVFAIYNVYNRYNPYFIYFDQTGDINQGNISLQAKQVSLFPIIPSITWNFKIK